MPFLVNFTSEIENPFSWVLAYGCYKQNFDATRDGIRASYAQLPKEEVLPLRHEYSFKDAGWPSLKARQPLEPYRRRTLPRYVAHLFGCIEAISKVTDEVIGISNIGI
jgi:hypothetical protein